MAFVNAAQSLDVAFGGTGDAVSGEFESETLESNGTRAQILSTLTISVENSLHQ